MADSGYDNVYIYIFFYVINSVIKVINVLEIKDPSYSAYDNPGFSSGQ